ncbi:glycosyltransferase family 4 protein [Nibribacter koreensis]|uniref:Glycosyltransferase n=1 Tax=Nibribacter koreensis TaxID=1084519 RepID=A0ABP8FH57_9BACT
MKVLHFCHSFSPLSETFIYDLILQLDDVGIKNMICAKKRENDIERPYSDVSIVAQNDSINNFSKVYNKLKTLFVTDAGKINWLKRERDAVRNNCSFQSVDVVHAHFGPQGCIIHPVVEEYNIPLVVSFHGFDAFVLPNDMFWVNQLRILFEKATVITVVSNMMKEHLVKIGCLPEKIHIIHVGKKVENYDFSLPLDKKIRKFISVGRMVEKKGHFDVVQAFHLLLKNYPDLCLEIVGDGPMLYDIQRYIEENDLSNNIHILGAVSHKETVVYMKKSDAFILCSKIASNGDREGIPTVIMEAQALGLPCVVTNHSGIPEVVPLENKWLMAKEGDISSIARTVDALISAPSSTIRETVVCARRKVESDFNLRIEVNKLIAVYNKISKNSRANEGYYF